MSIYRQGPAPANSCPRCREALVAVGTVPGVSCCERCGGVFADVEATRRIVSQLDRTLLEVGFAAGLGKPRTSHETRAIGCPECLVEMQRTPVTSAMCEVDVCPAHGTWFDTGELEDVMRAYTNSRKRGVRPPRGATPTPSPLGAAGTNELGSEPPEPQGLLTMVLALLGLPPSRS